MLYLLSDFSDKVYQKINSDSYKNCLFITDLHNRFKLISGTIKFSQPVMTSVWKTPSRRELNQSLEIGTSCEFQEKKNSNHPSNKKKLSGHLLIKKRQTSFLMNLSAKLMHSISDFISAQKKCTYTYPSRIQYNFSLVRYAEGRHVQLVIRLAPRFVAGSPGTSCEYQFTVERIAKGLVFHTGHEPW